MKNDNSKANIKNHHTYWNKLKEKKFYTDYSEIYKLWASVYRSYI